MNYCSTFAVRMNEDINPNNEDFSDEELEIEQVLRPKEF